MPYILPMTIQLELFYNFLNSCIYFLNLHRNKINNILDIYINYNNMGMIKIIFNDFPIPYYESIFQKCVSHVYSNKYKNYEMLFTEFDHQPLFIF